MQSSPQPPPPPSNRRWCRDDSTRRTPGTSLPSPSPTQVLSSPLIRCCDAVHSAGHDLHHRRDASLPLKINPGHALEATKNSCI
uniref:Uncharacterized protein n=1 Tax=Oryza punctata TaxID=4537 RepID=A0A0E0KT31_ORYPU